MSLKDHSIAQQRDRFLAFAFTAADVLIEIDAHGAITFASGSIHANLGRDEQDLIGMHLPELASATDRIFLQAFLDKLSLTKRVSHQLIDIQLPTNTAVPTVICGMASPDRAGLFHITLQRMPLMGRLTEAETAEIPMTPEDFAKQAARVCGSASASGERLKLALYDMNWDEVSGVLDEEAAESLDEAIAHTVRAWAAGGSGVSKNADGRYSVLLEENVDEAFLADRLNATAEAHDERLADIVESDILSIDDVLMDDSLDAFLETALELHGENGSRGFSLAMDEWRNGPDEVLERPTIFTGHSSILERLKNGGV